MDTILFPKKESWEGLCKRPVLNDANLDKPVRDILKRVKSGGDKALVDMRLFLIMSPFLKLKFQLQR